MDTAICAGAKGGAGVKNTCLGKYPAPGCIHTIQYLKERKKTMKKVLSIILCVALMMSMSIAVLADETTYTLTIHNPTKGHTYEAYQIFSGTLEKVSGWF